ncbi:MAG: Ig-like domain-containing protein [Armatimonadetes bacterium]|nr:Ig-like domain-containing protein [Armatimonadota bacterium]
MPSSLLKSVLAALVALSIAACGGGGGTAKSLVYETDWTNRGRGVTGLSQSIEVFDSQGRRTDSLIVNQDTEGIQTVRLALSGSGPYHVHVDLYSQRDNQGTKTGEIDALVTGGSFKSQVGINVASVFVTPQNTAFQVQHSKQFYATGYGVAAKAVFVEPGSFEWSVLGSSATISETGLALGVAEGSGTARATYTPDNIQGSSVFTVEPFDSKRTRWTVLVYLNAANDLYSFSDLNVNQMEQVATNPQVRFVVQWKQSKSLFSGSSFDGTRRYLVRADNTSQIASELIQDMGTSVDMGQAQTLTDFIAWGKTYYPADRYCLVIWNHGNGWRRGIQEPSRAVSYDDETGNSIQIWQLAQALGNNTFDIVAWDASLMQMLEVAYEIQDKALYVVGGEESPPGEGYPYDLIFKKFRDQDTDTTRNLTKAFVDGMLAVPGYASRKITQSVIDTSKLPALGTAVDALADELIANVGTIGSAIVNVRTSAQSYSPTSNRVYRDLVHVCDLLISQVSVTSIQTAAGNVKTAINDALVWEGHNSNSPNSHGVSIDFSSSTTFNLGTTAVDYALMRFAADTSWNEWLQIAP